MKGRGLLEQVRVGSEIRGWLSGAVERSVSRRGRAIEDNGGLMGGTSGEYVRAACERWRGR